MGAGLKRAFAAARATRKPKKCSCKHEAKHHYFSDVKPHHGKVYCGRDNCTGWQHCDIDPRVVPKLVKVNSVRAMFLS